MSKNAYFVVYPVFAVACLENLERNEGMKETLPTNLAVKPEANLLTDIRELIESSRQRVAVGVNSELSLLYWHVGKRINHEILGDDRAEYGKQVVAVLAELLSKEYGRGWSKEQLKQCLWFAKIFPQKEIGYTLCNQLSWSQIRLVLPVEDPLKRDFYIEMCKQEHWSVRTLRERMDSMLYERTAISKKPDQTIKNDLASLKNEDKMTPALVFRDPYFLDFLGLKDTFSEKDLESAILSELQRFIVEFGTDFAFLARQKRITFDNDDYYMDLLFYHRALHRLIVVDLKLGDFKIEYKAQMEFYLRWLNENDRHEGENEPLGIILCAGKKQKLVELLELGKSGIHVAEYFTELPPRELLEKKLLSAIQTARASLETGKGDHV
jgi:predicted nuclease of restriction endonuclease-like (RecB) superfamily